MPPALLAPEFPDNLQWLNTAHPLRFHGDASTLRGRVVLLNFFTACSINCRHVQPDLIYLQQLFADKPFTIVGIHTPKFTREKDPNSVKIAVKRLGITHPVVLDSDMQIWKSYAVTAWPTQVLVNAEGNIVGAITGEGNRTVLEKSIRRTLSPSLEISAASEPSAFDNAESFARLKFPGKVWADPLSRRLFIADTNQHRILITELPEEPGRAALLEIIGTGHPGHADGSFNQAQFNRPQGFTLAGNILYVADTDNHLIRRVDLKHKTVSTVLGTGERVVDREAGKSGKQQGLNSPWDVAIQGSRLYISMAGQHQIFIANTLTWMAEPFAGSGRENLYDGPAINANLAQPAGMALDSHANRLYFVDSETSAMRYIDLGQKTVQTLVGQGLFEFGDVDGPAAKARLQNPLGITVAPATDLQPARVWVADTYNHKIREVDPETGAVRTLTPPDGFSLNEPGSVGYAEEKFFIADTNNHRIVMVHIAGNLWTELVIQGLPAFPQSI